MKRIMVVLLTIMLLLSVGYSNAENTEDSNPILFRGVEWGVKQKDAEKALSGIKFNSPDTYTHWRSVKDFLTDAYPYTFYYNSVLGYNLYATDSSKSNLKVAGYQVNSIGLKFVYLTDDNGILVRDAEHSALITATYTFKVTDKKAVFDDLTDKLTSLYGEIDESYQDGYSIVNTINIWYGSEGTLVVLRYEKYSSGSETLYLSYGFQGGDELIEAAYRGAVKKEIQEAASDTDGL